MNDQSMTVEDFRAWKMRMGFDAPRGGQAKAAAALGLTTATVRNYENGKYFDGRPIQYPLTRRLAMSALAMGLPAWPPHVDRAARVPPINPC